METFETIIVNTFVVKHVNNFSLTSCVHGLSGWVWESSCWTAWHWGCTNPAMMRYARRQGARCWRASIISSSPSLPSRWSSRSWQWGYGERKPISLRHGTDWICSLCWRGKYRQVTSRHFSVILICVREFKCLFFFSSKVIKWNESKILNFSIIKFSNFQYHIVKEKYREIVLEIYSLVVFLAVCITFVKSFVRSFPVRKLDDLWDSI